MRCPICGTKPTTICGCIRKDSQCNFGHQWHTCSYHKKIVLGFSDHPTSPRKCTCIKEK